MSETKRQFATHRWGLPWYSWGEVGVCERCRMARVFVRWQGCCAIYRYTNGDKIWSGVGPGMCDALPETTDE